MSLLELNPPKSAAARYAVAVMLALIGIAVRGELDPIFHATQTYHAFYPGLIIAAYFLGRGPSILFTTLSIAVSYWFFTDPEFGWKFDVTTLYTLALFLVHATVAIYFITGMRSALADLARSRAEAEALAADNADLFRNLNERVTNHLQLIAALLGLQARDAKDAVVGKALSEASARTLLISRAHRDLAGETDRILDFDRFARQLLDAAIAVHPGSNVRINIRPTGSRIPIDEATSVAVVLLECLNACLSREDAAVLDIAFHRGERRAKLTVFEADADPQVALRLPMIEAMVEQLGGSFRAGFGDGGLIRELEFPVGGEEPAGHTLSQTLH